jgi:hypothetical protein
LSRLSTQRLFLIPLDRAMMDTRLQTDDFTLLKGLLGS